MPTVAIGLNIGNIGSIQDTYLSFNSPDFSGVKSKNYGGSSVFATGHGPAAEIYRSLIRFDLSLIPAQSHIVSATLYCRVAETSVNACTINIFRVSSANGNWPVGTGAGTFGYCCWNYNESSSAPWAGTAGVGTAGTDYVNEVLSSADFSSSTPLDYAAFPLNANGLLVLREWLGSGVNDGLLLRGTEQSDTRVSLNSSDAADGLRPYLVINYVASPFPFPRLTS